MPESTEGATLPAPVGTLPLRPAHGGTFDGSTPTGDDEGRPGTPEPPGRRPFRPLTWSPSWLLRPLAIVLVSRAVVWATIAVCDAVTGLRLEQSIDRWDSRWFLRAASQGWPTTLPYRHGHVDGSTVAFFPLFPLLIRWIAEASGLSVLAAGILLTSVTSLTATVAVWMLVRHDGDQGRADRATLLFALFPGSFALTLVYSEGLAITLVAFGLLALLRRRWWLAGVLGLLATATTPVALAFEVSCLWCAYRAVRPGRQWAALAAPLLTPVGFVAFQLWLWWHTGSLASWRLTERQGWDSYPSLAYPVHAVIVVLRDPIVTDKTQDLVFVGIVAASAAVVVAVRTRLSTPLLLYGVAAAAAAMVSAPVGLRPRFLFLAFPLVLAVGGWLRGRVYAAVVGASALLLVGMTVLEMCWWQVFP